MARPPLPLGHHGSIKTTRESGQWVARCRVRDLDGITRKVERWGLSRIAAQHALQGELRQRRGERAELLRPQSRFRDAADVWMAKITERREDSTTDTYRHWLDGLVLPQLGELRLYECDVAHIDAFFSRLEQARHTVEHEDGSTSEKVRYAANTRRTIRAIVAGVLQQAVLHQAIASNPVRELEHIESPKGHRTASPRGLTPEERRRLLAFVDTDKVAVSADLPDLIRFAIGSGLRIGELCAVRWIDLNLAGIPVVTENDLRLVPVVAVRQNVYPVKGKGLTVHGGKTTTALRIVPLPELVTTRLRVRRHGDENPEWPVFAAAGRDGRPTYRWPSNVRRSVRAVREQVGLKWMTPHTWRRTYATILDDEMSLTDRAKADLMGQAKFLKILKGRTRKGNTELCTVLTECAWAAGRTSTYVGAQFRRFHRRFGKKGGQKAATATAHTLIVIIWHVLAETTGYRDLGSDYFTRRTDSPEARKRRLIRELEALGHKITIEPAAA